MRWAVGLAATGLLIVLMAACGSSAGASRTTGLPTTCQRVTATLSDGPDPSVDPVGYAQAQILPLARLHTSNLALRSAISQLDGAFRAVESSGGSARAEHEVTRSDSAIDASCPGATG